MRPAHCCCDALMCPDGTRWSWCEGYFSTTCSGGFHLCVENEPVYTVLNTGATPVTLSRISDNNYKYEVAGSHKYELTIDPDDPDKDFATLVASVWDEGPGPGLPGWVGIYTINQDLSRITGYLTYTNTATFDLQAANQWWINPLTIAVSGVTMCTDCLSGFYNGNLKLAKPTSLNANGNWSVLLDGDPFADVVMGASNQCVLSARRTNALTLQIYDFGDCNGTVEATIQLDVIIMATIRGNGVTVHMLPVTDASHWNTQYWIYEGSVTPSQNWADCDGEILNTSNSHTACGSTWGQDGTANITIPSLGT